MLAALALSAANSSRARRVDTKKMKPDRRSGSWKQGCTVETTYPGFVLGPDDSGLASIGKIERTYALPEFVASMHPHRDDEIFSYVRSGTVLHLDSMGHEEKISSTRLRVINAGTAFQHEERVLGRDPVEAFHVVFRPERSGLEPMVQFVDITTTQPRPWRLLAARTRAPLILRVKAWLHDAHLDVGPHLLPAHTNRRIARVLIVMEGDVRIGGKCFQRGDIAAVSDQANSLVAIKPADVLLVTADTADPFFSNGLSSGNTGAIKSRPPVPLSGTSRSRFGG
ncbi:pirin family protein [Sinorhizobium sp. 22678]|uniref:pirin family protein n=1 Tax=Sinorhizobium sp. 22678 TaxID=3453955 RepID=UPI003F85120D